MTTYYVDTSALVKRYIDEAGSDWVRADDRLNDAAYIARRVGLV